MINAFKIVPIQGFWFNGSQKIKTTMLISIVIIPTEKPTFKKIPCARTLHGEAPVVETINNPSPSPNKASPKHKKKNVEIFGFRFKGLFELHETLGTFFIDKNIV